MTLRQALERIQNIVAMNDREGRSAYNDLPLYASVQLSPRRRHYFPATAFWGGCLSLQPTGQPEVRCVELRCDGTQSVVIKST